MQRGSFISQPNLRLKSVKVIHVYGTQHLGREFFEVMIYLALTSRYTTCDCNPLPQSVRHPLFPHELLSQLPTCLCHPCLCLAKTS